MISRDKLYFGVFGDLLFFYDMNSLGNRDICSNVRIMIVNNGLGQEFKNYSCYSAAFGEETDLYIAAKGHFVNGTKDTIQKYAESLGFSICQLLTKKNLRLFQNVLLYLKKQNVLSCLSFIQIPKMKIKHMN